MFFLLYFTDNKSKTPASGGIGTMLTQVYLLLLLLFLWYWHNVHGFFSYSFPDTFVLSKNFLFAPVVAFIVNNDLIEIDQL